MTEARMDGKAELRGWRPIAEYDAMKKKPPFALFRFKPVFKADRPHSSLKAHFAVNQRTFGYRECTHFLPFETPTVEGELTHDH